MGGGFGGEEDEAIDDMEPPSRYKTLAGLIHMAPEVQKHLLRHGQMIQVRRHLVCIFLPV
jgi:hypothetical protein